MYPTRTVSIPTANGLRRIFVYTYSTYQQRRFFLSRHKRTRFRPIAYQSSVVRREELMVS